jgi:hypothetical protein
MSLIFPLTLTRVGSGNRAGLRTKKNDLENSKHYLSGSGVVPSA